MFDLSRGEARDFLFGVWAKARAGAALAPLEEKALAIVLEHPEYHDLLSQPERFRDRTWTPEDGETNPFLHLALHLALDEQSAIDQPPGIRAALDALARALGSPHAARHAAMECLAEVLWRAQRHGAGFDNEAYLDCLRRRA